MKYQILQIMTILFAVLGVAASSMRIWRALWAALDRRRAEVRVNDRAQDAAVPDIQLIVIENQQLREQLKMEQFQNLGRYATEKMVWSKRTFGEGARTRGLLEHLRDEVNEVEKDPYDLTEWIDIMMLAIDGYWRHGGKNYRLMNDLWKKFEICKMRVYPTPVGPEDMSQHIRGVDDAG